MQALPRGSRRFEHFTSGDHMIRLAVVALAMTSFVLRAADVAADPAVVLAQILSQKGTISAAELSRVQGADEHNRLTVLTSILQDKGLLNSGDLARISVPGTGVSAQPVVRAKSEAPAPPNSSSGTATTASAEVTTNKDLPVSLYGTLIWTAGYNTA